MLKETHSTSLWRLRNLQELGRKSFGPAHSSPGPVLCFRIEKWWGGFGVSPGPDTECTEGDEWVLSGRLWVHLAWRGEGGGMTQGGWRLPGASFPPRLGRDKGTQRLWAAYNLWAALSSKAAQGLWSWRPRTSLPTVMITANTFMKAVLSSSLEVL